MNSLSCYGWISRHGFSNCSNRGTAASPVPLIKSTYRNGNNTIGIPSYTHRSTDSKTVGMDQATRWNSSIIFDLWSESCLVLKKCVEIDVLRKIILFRSPRGHILRLKPRQICQPRNAKRSRVYQLSNWNKLDWPISLKNKPISCEAWSNTTFLILLQREISQQLMYSISKPTDP